MNNNNALTSRQYGMMIVFVVITAYMLYISIKGMREETRKMKETEQSKTSNYEIQGVDMKKSDNAKWIPLSIILGGIVVTIGVVAMSSRSNKRMKN